MLVERTVPWVLLEIVPAGTRIWIERQAADRWRVHIWEVAEEGSAIAGE